MLRNVPFKMGCSGGTRRGEFSVSAPPDTSVWSECLEEIKREILSAGADHGGSDTDEPQIARVAYIPGP